MSVEAESLKSLSGDKFYIGPDGKDYPTAAALQGANQEWLSRKAQLEGRSRTTIERTKEKEIIKKACICPKEIGHGRVPIVDLLFPQRINSCLRPPVQKPA